MELLEHYNAPALTSLKQIRDKYETGYSVGQIKLASKYPKNLPAPVFAKLIEYGTRWATHYEADPAMIGKGLTLETTVIKNTLKKQTITIYEGCFILNQKL